MLNTVFGIWNILTPLDKRKVGIVSLLVILMAIVESIGVISIMPFLAVLADFEVVNQNKLLKKLYIFLDVNNINEFIVYLGGISLFIVIFSEF